MYELYEYDGFGEYLMDTFETREELEQYMINHNLLAEYEEGYFGRCPNGEEINL